MSVSDEPGPSCDAPCSSKKRVRKEDTWKATQRKKKRNSGEAYTSKHGKQVQYDNGKGGTCFILPQCYLLQMDEKVMNEQPCRSGLRCFSVLSTEQRKRIFSKFWGLGSFDIQNAYLCGCVKVLPVKHHYSATSRRGNTRVFYVHNGENSVRICKVASLRIHGISNGRLSRVLAGQAQEGGLPKLDKRGRKEPPNKTSEEDIQHVREHINTFPVYTSHYSRADNPDRKYLSPHLSISKMYHLYKEECTQEGRSTVVSEWIYRREFNEHFNLSFGRYRFHLSLPLLPTHPPTHYRPPSPPSAFTHC